MRNQMSRGRYLCQPGVGSLIVAPLALAGFPAAHGWAGGEGAASPAAADSTEVRRAVDAGNAAFLRAWKAGDAVLFSMLFAEDGALLQPGGRLIRGRDRILERMKDVFARVRMTEGTITTVDVFVLGDTAFETGKWRFTIGPIGQPAEPDSGHYVEVWKRDGTRGWHMWRDIGVPR